MKNEKHERCLYCGNEDKQAVTESGICTPCINTLSQKNSTNKNIAITESDDDEEYWKQVRKNKKIGIILIVAPIIGLIFVLFTYALMSFVLSTLTKATGI